MKHGVKWKSVIIEVYNKEVKELLSFKCLSSSFNSVALSDEVVKSRLAIASSHMGQLNPMRVMSD